jgi:hypothetical protein
MNAKHWCPHSHARDHCVCVALELAAKPRDVSRRAAHVEGHHTIKPVPPRFVCSTNKPPRWTRKHGAAPPKRRRINEPTAALHAQHVCVAKARNRLGHTILDDRRKTCVKRHRIEPRYQSAKWVDFAGHYFFESNLGGDSGYLSLMAAIRPAMQERHRHTLASRVIRVAQVAAELNIVKWLHN